MKLFYLRFRPPKCIRRNRRVRFYAFPVACRYVSLAREKATHGRSAPDEWGGRSVFSLHMGIDRQSGPDYFYPEWTAGSLGLFGGMPAEGGNPWPPVFFIHPYI